MVDPRDGSREDFIINENYAPAEEVDLSREEYYERPSAAFKKRSIAPVVIGGLGLVVLVVQFFYDLVDLSRHGRFKSTRS